jgi:hypothetical protein
MCNFSKHQTLNAVADDSTPRDNSRVPRLEQDTVRDGASAQHKQTRHREESHNGKENKERIPNS